MTHSLEVAYLGRLIATKLVSRLREREVEPRPKGFEEQTAFISLVETACLAHDIGNPPFGHFGETAIRDWFGDAGKTCFGEAVGRDHKEWLDEYGLPDFIGFDGNAQGFRILTRLQNIIDENSLNLTHSQLASFLKYTRSTVEPKKEAGFARKAGFFASEAPIVAEIWRSLELEQHCRHPLVYIVEAADDIAYCISDIEDAIDKGIKSVAHFVSEGVSKLPETVTSNCRTLSITSTESDFFQWKTDLIRTLVDICVDRYTEDHENILAGASPPLLEASKESDQTLTTLKSYARGFIYTSSEAQRPEIAGYHVLTALLNTLRPLLTVNSHKFDNALNQVRENNNDLHLRLANLLPEKHVKAYKYAVASLPGPNGKRPQDSRQQSLDEWYWRSHLVLDYLSGMTDGYALKTYRSLCGMPSGG